MQAAWPPQTPGVPPPPQVWGGVHVPHCNVLPQPSPIGPQLAPADKQVRSPQPLELPGPVTPTLPELLPALELVLELVGVLVPPVLPVEIPVELPEPLDPEPALPLPGGEALLQPAPEAKPAATKVKTAKRVIAIGDL
jgi:hypothetical protein